MKVDPKIKASLSLLSQNLNSPQRAAIKKLAAEIEAYHGSDKLIEEFDSSYQKELGFHFWRNKRPGRA